MPMSMAATVCWGRRWMASARAAVARPDTSARQITGTRPITPDEYAALDIGGNVPYLPAVPRPGVLALKKGMMTLYDQDGLAHPVTCLHIDRCQAMSIRNIDPVGKKQAYRAVAGSRRRELRVLEMGMGKKSGRQLPTGRLQMFTRLGLAPKRYVRGFVVGSECNVPAGHYFRAAHFVPGQLVDVQARSIGKGFQGVMKRWGFKGFPASHGASLSHRSRGSSGARSLGRVWKGTRMAGRMGGKLRTIRRLKVMRIDNALNLLYVRGAVPGVDDALVKVVDTKSGGNAELFARMPPPCPTFIPKPQQRLPRLLVAPKLSSSSPSLPSSSPSSSSSLSSAKHHDTK